MTIVECRTPNPAPTLVRFCKPVLANSRSGSIRREMRHKDWSTLQGRKWTSGLSASCGEAGSCSERGQCRLEVLRSDIRVASGKEKGQVRQTADD